MRKFLKLFLFILALAILPAAWIARRGLPADTHMLVEKKYAGWSGVLRAWIASDWSSESGFMRWLDECAAGFEKTREGVRIEFAYVETEEMNDLFAGDVPPPELIFISPGILKTGEGLLAISGCEKVRDVLRTDARAIPVAMGGYICARNENARTDAFEIPTDGARRYGEAAEYIMEEAEESETAEREDVGMDLGLPTFGKSEISVSAGAFEDFVSGEVKRTVITQKELSRLIAMEEAGRGPDWSCEISGRRTLCDQLLLGAIPETDAARAQIAQAFIEWLLREESQALLSKIGAFGVTEGEIYPEYSAYAPMERLLRTRIPVIPPPFGETP